MAEKKSSVFLFRILLAILLGMVCSLFFPEWAARIFVTFNSLFGNFLGMFIPLLIIGLVAPAISDLGRGAGALLIFTLILAYLSTVLTGLFSYFSCRAVLPLILDKPSGNIGSIDFTSGLEPYFTIEMPAFINVVTALVTALIIGLGTAAIPGKALKSVTDDFRDVVMITIKELVIPLLPVFIFGIFLKMGVEGKVGSVLGMFIKVIGLIIVLHIIVLVLQFLIAGAVSGRKPFRSLWAMLPAYFTALGTSSSAATIPVTYKCVKNLGIDVDVAEFTVPLCATVHMPCSILKIVACTMAVSMSLDMPVNFGLFFVFILMLSITMVAAPGVPGGAIMASLGVMASVLGFDSDMQGLVIAVYIAIDCFGTAGNVTGDGAVAMIVDKFNTRAKK